MTMAASGRSSAVLRLLLLLSSSLSVSVDRHGYRAVAQAFVVPFGSTRDSRLHQTTTTPATTATQSTTATVLASTRRRQRPLCVSDVHDDTNTEVEFLDEDDDGNATFDLDEALSQKSHWMTELRRLSRNSRQDPTATDKAQQIFDKMFEAYVLAENSALWPETEVYNLLIETHAYSQNSKGAEEAERLLARMEDETVELIARPDRQTYISVIDAWSMRKSPDKALQTIDRLKKRWNAQGKPDHLEPNVDVYNKFIKAYGVVEDYDQVETIFRSLVDAEGATAANYKTWVQVMKAYITRQDAVYTIRSMMQEMHKRFRMGEEQYKPKTDVYNNLIRAVSRQKGGALDAEAIIYQMIDLYRKGDQHVMPNCETFLITVMAFKHQRDAGMAAKIETLFQIQNSLYQQSGFREDLRPNRRLFNSVIGGLAQSRDKRKATRAKRIFDKLKKSEDGANEVSYYLLIKACANTRGGDAESNLQTFQIAVDALKESSDLFGCDSACHGMFLRACGTLMPPSRKRDAVVQKVFQKCCEEGRVNKFVLKEFERASSEELQLDMLGGFLEDGVRIPKEWERNSVEFMR